MSKHRGKIIGIKDLTKPIRNKIWKDLTKGYILKEIVKRNNVSAYTIDFIVKEKMRINRFDLKE
tara:strand:+ start:1597 stop:1788 length:192 start_codon:yes stop_codon:yes gene_type:complete